MVTVKPLQTGRKLYRQRVAVISAPELAQNFTVSTLRSSGIAYYCQRHINEV